jgi:molybdopterin converting factor subunit 1
MSKEELDLRSIKVKLFASSRELLGRDEIRVSLDNQTTVGDLKKMIVEMHPSLSKKPAFVVAVNHKVVDDSTIINHLDEVAILPPVSGG